MFLILEDNKISMLKKIMLAFLIIVITGACFVIYLWNKPHKKIETAKSISTTAQALSKEYTENEKQADAKYLNKAIEVSGVVNEVDKNQDGGTMVILQTDDPVAGIQCTMREKGITAGKGQNVTIKGFCSGNGITGVSLTDCVLE
jgi:hypothetical protein